MKISVISLISYDAEYLPESIKSYYNFVDEIILGLDESRISWSGNKFSFDEDKLSEELQKIDTEGKIFIVESNFHRSSNPIENDTHERNYLKTHCSNELVLSFDADEVLVNAKDFFIKFLPKVKDYSNIELMFTWFLLYKELDEGYLVIADENREHVFNKDIQGFSANKLIHTYHYCRWTNATKKLLTPLAIKHKSFCRPKKQLLDKVKNFGHSAESINDPFYEVQDKINISNYKNLRNFKTHGAGAQWSTLKLIPKNELDSYLEQEAKLIYAS